MSTRLGGDFEMRNIDRVFGAVSRVSNAYPGHSASQDGLLPKPWLRPPALELPRRLEQVRPQRRPAQSQRPGLDGV